MPRPIPDITGQVFGDWTAIEKKMHNGRTHYLCRCVCGKEKLVEQGNLRKGKSTGCGCRKAEKVSQSKLQDISGQKFGRLTAIKIDHREPPKTFWYCECDCGQTKIVDINNLTQGHTKSCGCLDKENKQNIGQRNLNDLSGQRFNKLTVLYPTKSKNGHMYFMCKCDCGNKKEISGTHLLSGNTGSCGCSISKGEDKIVKILKENNINFIQQYTFKNCINSLTGYKLFFDFYLPDFNLCIEYNGEQHYYAREKGLFTEDIVKEIQLRDKIKIDYCNKNNIKLNIIKYTELDKINLQMLLGE